MGVMVLTLTKVLFLKEYQTRKPPFWGGRTSIKVGELTTYFRGSIFNSLIQGIGSGSSGCFSSFDGSLDTVGLNSGNAVKASYFSNAVLTCLFSIFLGVVA